MNIFECIKMAVKSLWLNKMRSFLTMIGIIIGISAVITITTIGNSVQKTFSNTFNSLGMNTLNFYVGQKDYDEEYEMTDEDLINDEMMYGLVDKNPDLFKLYQEEDYAGGKILSKKGEQLSVNVSGWSDGSIEMNKYKIIKGRSLTYRDIKEKKYTAVVSDVFLKQYGDDSVVGKTLEIPTEKESIDVTVVGVYEYPKKQLNRLKKDGLSEKTMTTDILIPYSVVRELNGTQDEVYNFGYVVYDPEADKDMCIQKATEYFDKLYRSNEYCRVEIGNDETTLDAINGVLTAVTVAFAIIGAISLLVGGVGVMNIMLVSIVERTNEIGIRKALGAKDGSIKLQFVVESMTICIIGGIIGIVSGILNGLLLNFVANRIMGSMAENSEVMDYIELTVQPSFTAVVISIVCVLLIGIIFGYYPAKRAAKMNPIDALRHD